MNIATLATLVGLVTSVGGGGVWLATTYATNDQVQVAESKANQALDWEMQGLLERINYLEAKKNKTVDDLEQLRYWRDELNRLREVRNQ